MMGCSMTNKSKTSNFDGTRYHNQVIDIDKGLWQVLKWKFSSTPKEWPRWTENTAIPQIPTHLPENKVIATFINHATFLLQTHVGNILTDPVFSERVSPVSWLGPKRFRPPGLKIEELPPIHFVVISHNHYDHMDADSIQKISEKFNPLFIVPLGNAQLIQKMGAKNIIELDWWQEHEIKDKNLKMILTPAQHWSSRSLFDRNKSLWGSFVIHTPKYKIYFAGDTGYGPHFKETSTQYGPMSLSLIPIGAYEPRWFMREQHLNPDDAVLAHIDLKSKQSIGMHFGTFQLTDEGIDDPANDLIKSLEKNKIPNQSFVIPQNGQSIEVEF